MTTAPNRELIAIFTPDGFVLDHSPTDEKHVWLGDSLLADYKQDPLMALYRFAFSHPEPSISQSVAFLHRVAKTFVLCASGDSEIEIRRRAKPPQEHTLEDLMDAVPYALGAEHIDFGWLRAIWTQLGSILADELAENKGSVADYFKSKDASINVVGRIFFHLVEHKSDDRPFAFLATYSTGSPDSVSHVPLKNALLEYEGQHEKLLSLLGTVSRAAEGSEFISQLVESGELFSPLAFSTSDAYSFLREIPLYEESGIVCRIPDWWKRKGSAGIQISIGEDRKTGVGFDAILSFNASVHLGGVELSREEAEALMSESDGLSFIKGKWVEVNKEKLGRILQALDRFADTESLTLSEAMRLHLGVALPSGIDAGDELVIRSGAWLASLRDRLTEPRKLADIDAGNGFLGTLRGYQQQGLNWLYTMHMNGFGALLADDMGLGKTVQILAMLEHMRAAGGVRALLVIPASLLGNWQMEAKKFAPMLRLKILHTDSREFNPDEADLFVTTYGMTLRIDALRSIDWDLVILDEAQAIKNPAAKQSKIARELRAKTRIAMTGTPIENRTSDLWSIFEFLNAGMLGTAKQFANLIEGFKEGDNRGYSRLKRMVAPFILRRLKTDKRIIDDLPEKIEIKEYTTLTKKQVVLYEALVHNIAESLNSAEGIARKGLILASIIKLKQICNHPDHYNGQGVFKADQSGKMQHLTEICGTIAEKREKVLVFTQFREMTDPLHRHLSTVFGREGLVIHGGTPTKKRQKIVEDFKDEAIPYMVLSLKAGGVGLNLTAANHVVHFDRWWNPAVENQATDRAFRIGQSRNVMVHKFVTAGTIEEKIDKMLEDKKELADRLIAPSGEAWLTEMSNEEFLDLLTLGAAQ